MSQLPDGWARVSLGELGDWGSGGTPAKGVKSYYDNGTIPWVVIGDLNDGYVSSAASQITEDGLRNSSAKLLPIDTLLIAMYGSIGKLGITKIECATNQAIAYCRPTRAVVDLRYLFYLLMNEKSALVGQGQGGAQQNISQGILKAHEVSLAPPPEQKRIADKLDVLLARVDATRARLDRIPGVLKQFRQSVLAAATNGELTEEWRGLRSHETAQALFDALLKDHEDVGGHKRGNASDPTEDAHDLSQDTIPMDWRVVTMKDVCAPGRPITYGILKPGPELDEGVPYVRVADFPGNKLSLANIKKTSSEMDEQFRRSRLIPGDLLLSIRGSVGRLVEIPQALSGANITQDTARLSISGRLCARYVYFVLLSEDVQRRMRLSTRGVAVRGINIGDVRALQIPLPPISEQTEIVRRVETLFALADKVQTQYTAARARIDKLTASILAKAFRGELVPQDPNDEPASVLLERMRAQRDAAPAVARRGRKPSAKH